jgi:hypothetical protein
VEKVLWLLGTVGTIAWAVMGTLYTVDTWPDYESGALEASCPSSHLYQACVTELVFAAVGTLIAARIVVCLKWNHIVIWHAVFWLFSRNMPYLLNFSVPL